MTKDELDYDKRIGEAIELSYTLLKRFKEGGMSGTQMRNDVLKLRDELIQHQTAFKDKIKNSITRTQAVIKGGLNAAGGAIEVGAAYVIGAGAIAAAPPSGGVSLTATLAASA